MLIKAIKLFVCILLATTSIQGYAQITLNGKVEGGKEPLPFATISLFELTDTINPVNNTLTDLTGSYKISNVKPGKYIVRISYIGFDECRSAISLRMPSGGNSIVRDFELTASPRTLGEVVVSTSRNTVYADHTKYVFSNDQRSRARHSADLLENVGDLTIDPISGNLSKLSGGSVTVLINGVNASINDLKSIPANKIKYAEYYTIPPARYSSSTAVVNIVTKTLDNGTSGGIDISHAVTAGFFNDDAFFRATDGNSQFVINYRINYRDYKNRFVNDHYDYLFSGKTIQYKSNARNKFGYTTHIPEIKYIYSNPSSISFQATFKPELENKSDNSDSGISIIEQGNTSQGQGEKRTKSHYFGPSLDIYLSKKNKDNSEFAANIVATYYDGSLNSCVDEAFDCKDICTFNDDMSRTTSKKSLIGELFYTKKTGFNSVTLGYKATFSQASAIGRNILTDYQTARYKSDYASNYVYGEYSGVYRKLMYRLNIGGTFVSSSNSDADYDKLYVTPQLILDWNIKEKHHITFNAKSSPIIPTLTQLSNNAEYVTSYLIHTGNPMLKSGISYTNVLGYKYCSSILDMTLGLTYNLDSNPIELFYSPAIINGQDYIIAKEDNANSLIQYGGIFSGKISLLSDKLSLRVVSLALEQRLKDNNNRTTRNLYCPTFIQLSYDSRKWGASYKCNIPQKQISGSKLLTDENVSSLNAYFQHHDIRITASCQWFLTKARYKEQILDNDFIKHSSKLWIDDNKSMFVIGFSWNFFRGKKGDFNKRLNNIDTDNGTF